MEEMLKYFVWPACSRSITVEEAGGDNPERDVWKWLVVCEDLPPDISPLENLLKSRLNVLSKHVKEDRFWRDGDTGEPEPLYDGVFDREDAECFFDEIGMEVQAQARDIIHEWIFAEAFPKDIDELDERADELDSLAACLLERLKDMASGFPETIIDYRLLRLALDSVRTFFRLCLNEIERQKDGEIEDRSLIIKADCQKFSRAWPESFRDMLEKAQPVSDVCGVVEGGVNLEARSHEEAASILSQIAAKNGNRRFSPFESGIITWPGKTPKSRDEITETLKVLLEKYGMNDHALWWTSDLDTKVRKRDRKFRVRYVLCRVPRCPDASGNYVPGRGIVVDEIVRSNGSANKQVNYSACRIAAIAEMADRYGIPHHLPYSRNGILLGDPVLSPHDARAKRKNR